MRFYSGSVWITETVGLDMKKPAAFPRQALCVDRLEPDGYFAARSAAGRPWIGKPVTGGAALKTSCGPLGLAT